MDKRERLRQQKEKRRRERIKKTRLDRARHEQHVREFPQFVVCRDGIGHVPADFVEAVTSVLGKTRLYDRKAYPSFLIELFRLLKAGGVGALGEALASGATPRQENHLSALLILGVGEVLYLSLAQCGILDRYLPVCDVNFVPVRDIHVTFDALCTRKTEHGTVYHSRHKPTVAINNMSLTVAYTKHAVERLGERAVDNPLSYGGSGDVFAFLNHYTMFRLCDLQHESGKQLAVVFYEKCSEPFFSATFAKQILGVTPTDDDGLYYLVGYGPTVVEGDLLVVKTFLSPGMRGTPEWDLLSSASIPQAERVRLASSLEKSRTIMDLATSHDFAGLKWAHEAGAKQVIRFTKSPFAAEAARIRHDIALFASAGDARAIAMLNASSPGSCGSAAVLTQTDDQTERRIRLLDHYRLGGSA